MLKISFAGCVGLSSAISAQFSVEICAASKNCEKFTKTSFGGIQGRLRLSMLINLKSLLPVLVMVSSMFVPICNRFYTIRVNNGKMTFIRGTPIWRSRSKGIISPRGTKFRHNDLESLGSPQWRFHVSYVIFRCRRFDTVPGCDGQTDGQTPRPWLRRAKHFAIGRKNALTTLSNTTYVLAYIEFKANNVKGTLVTL